MTLDFLAQSLIAAAMLWAALNPRKVAMFIADCSDGNVAKLERIDEARAILAVMQPHRVG